jgi:hypothetical protein
MHHHKNSTTSHGHDSTTPALLPSQHYHHNLSVSTKAKLNATITPKATPSLLKYHHKSHTTTEIQLLHCRNMQQPQ